MDDVTTRTLPNSLSPSRVESFVTCPLAFRFSNIDKIPEPPSLPATRGSMVHLALQFFFELPPLDRTAAALDRCVDRAAIVYQSEPEYVDLQLDDDAAAAFLQESRRLAATYLTLEDPTTIKAIGLELKLEARVGDLILRGIIDRLDLGPDGELIVNDYKTGRAPSQRFEQKSLSGVNFYAFLCESVFGRRPAAVRLIYLKSGEIITSVPSAQSTKFIRTRTGAVWSAVERACDRDDFRPKPGPLCSYCSYQPWCPAFGGDPDKAAAEAPVALGTATKV